MKVIFDRQAILAATAPLLAATAGKSTLAATEGIKIEAISPDTCILTTYDLEKGMRTTIEAKVIEEGTFVVNAQKFNQTMRVMNGEEVSLTVDRNLCATIECGKSSHKMMALRGEDFPEIPRLESNLGFSVKAGTLKDMFTKVMYAMGVNDQRNVLNGCYVEVEQGKLLLVSCDSFKLAKCLLHTDEIENNNADGSDLRFRFIIPVKTVNELYRLLGANADENVRIHMMRKHMVFYFENLVFFSRLVDGEYIDFDRIIIRQHKIYIELDREELLSALDEVKNPQFSEIITRCRVLCCEEIIEPCVKSSPPPKIQGVFDRILTGRGTSTLVMVALLSLVFWLTLSGANTVSALLSDFLGRLEGEIRRILIDFSMPYYIISPLCDGVLHILFKVISVMTPPMAIFFPLFTILEDLGYLPRVAFNLDRHFRKCSSCGKQAYSMCMGFGCNAVGVAGARIIDSRRERLLAILTNCLVPCNGKFPALVSVISMFLVFSLPDNIRSASGSLVLTALVLISVFVTFFVTRILSKTLFKGAPSSFVLELPPYRRPEPWKIFVRSFLDRGVMLVLRATVAAAPCGLLVWCLANMSVGDKTLLLHFAEFLEPLGRLMGLDGTILLAFVLGFPANEIVIPLIIMGYSALGTISDDASLTAIRTLFLENGWTTVTAVNTIVFMMFHWPCATTLLTIRKETSSLKLTALAFIIPTAIGFCLCTLINLLF